MQLNPDDGRLQAGFAIYASYIHGQLQAALHTVLTLPFTTGLRLMVLLLSGAHWSLWEKEEESSEVSHPSNGGFLPEANSALSNNASNKYAFTLLLRSRGWQCFKRGAHDQLWSSPSQIFR